MAVYAIDPLKDERWSDLVNRHPNASVFHTRGWLQALKLTYGYEPVAFTTCDFDEDLTNAVPFCRIKSWITGRRLVSLPFSDHSQPLVDNKNNVEHILEHVIHSAEFKKLKYLELRPLQLNLNEGPELVKLGSSSSFAFHCLDLSQNEDTIFSHFHKTSIVQMIHRAEREKILCEKGSSESLLSAFYNMLLVTRRKHCVPPQPFDWFRNLLNCLGDCITIYVAWHDEQPIASILTAAFKDVCYYKYSCSLPQLSNLGGTQMLLWTAIKDAKESGATRFDMGRTDRSNNGLIAFKNRWGCLQSDLMYYRYPTPKADFKENHSDAVITKQLFAHCPDSLVIMAGKLLYKHMG